MKRTPLRKASLKRTPLRKHSAKSKVELKVWMQVKRERIGLITEKYGWLICEYCKTAISLDLPQGHAYCAEAHHNNHNRRVNTLDNARVVHRLCNQLIEIRHVKNIPSLVDRLDGDTPCLNPSYEEVE